MKRKYDTEDKIILTTFIGMALIGLWIIIKSI